MLLFRTLSAKETAMKISGIQKLTLLDYPGTVACTVFTAGCNFRCPFCHNAMLVLPEQIEDASLGEDEVLSFLKKRRGVLDGVAITGGEPLLHRELPELLGKIKALGYKIKLDTNGSNPEVLEKLISKNLLDFVAMDVKTSLEKYEEITQGKVDIEKIKKTSKIMDCSGGSRCGVYSAPCAKAVGGSVAC